MLLRKCVRRERLPATEGVRIHRKTYLDREEARRDIFNCIHMPYNPKRRHGDANDVSPVEFEKQYFNRLRNVSESRSDSCLKNENAVQY